MKKVLFSLMLIGCSIGFSNAQSSKHSFSFSIGAFPFTYDAEVFDGYDYHLPDLVDLWQNESIAIPGKLKTTGAISLAYQYRIKSWLELSTSITYIGFFQQWQNAKNETRHYIYVMPGVNLFWFRKPIVEMYSGFHLGYGSIMANKGWTPDTRHFGGFHLTLAGIRVGKERFYFMTEAGFGMKGFINAGLGYRL